MLWVAKLQPLVSVVWEKYASAVAHPYTKLQVRSPGCFVLMLVVQSGGMPTRNWSSIAVIDKSSAAIAVSPLASTKTAPGNIAPTTATLQTVSTEVTCNDKRTASG